MLKEYLEVVNGVATGGVFNNNPGITIEDSWVEITNEDPQPSIGDSYDGSVWTLTQGGTTDEERLESIRNERNRLLSETDYLALSDNTLTPEMATYRQALRDMTVGIDLDNPIYPTKP